MLADGQQVLTSRQQKILIIDEINYTRLMFDYALTSAGYKVSSARNSGEAMHSISVELPDVVLLSFRANDSGAMSILTVLKNYFRLRLDIAQGAEPPTIVLSGSRDTRQAQEAQSQGASEILFKPINMQQLLDSVRTTIENKQNIMPQTRKKVVIFDAETRSEKFLESILTCEMYDIEGTDSEEELIAKIRHGEFDLAIVDLASIKGGVVEVLERVNEVSDDCPVVAIATSTDRISEDELKELGIHIYLVKPLNVDVFRIEVDTLLKEESESETEETNQTPQ